MCCFLTMLMASGVRRVSKLSKLDVREYERPTATSELPLEAVHAKGRTRCAGPGAQGHGRLSRPPDVRILTLAETWVP